MISGSYVCSIDAYTKLAKTMIKAKNALTI